MASPRHNTPFKTNIKAGRERSGVDSGLSLPRVCSFLLAVAALLYLNAAVEAQAQSPQRPLELTFRITNQSYCAVNSESSSLELNLRLRYTNVGSQKLILYKGHDLFYQTRIRTAFKDGSIPYEVLLLNSRYFDEEIEPIDQPAPGKVFVIVAPGGFYERELKLGIPFASEKIERSKDAIRAGEHTLQLIVSTWYKSRAVAQKLRQQWSSKGFLWFDPLVTAPVNFVAQRPVSLAHCK